MHYYIKLKRPLSAESWFKMVRKLKACVKVHGLELGEWGDETEFDRETVRRAGQMDYCEGFIHNQASGWQPTLERALMECEVEYEYISY